MREKCCACAGSGWYDATDQNGNNIPCAACNGTGYEDGESKEVAELKQELIATRSRLVDMEETLELACIWIDNVSSLCANLLNNLRSL
jgi:hypothetical protein